MFSDPGNNISCDHGMWNVAWLFAKTGSNRVMHPLSSCTLCGGSPRNLSLVSHQPNLCRFMTLSRRR
jgi:hypothetical protein